MSDTNITVLALVGSLRAASINRQIAELAAAVAPGGVTVTVFEGLGDLPFYNEDIDPAMGARERRTAGGGRTTCRGGARRMPHWWSLRNTTAAIPAVVKNAIDWLSRPFGNGALKGKPLAVIGGSMGQYGGVWAHDETRKSFGIAGARVVEAIKLSVPFQTLGGTAPAENAELSAMCVMWWASSPPRSADSAATPERAGSVTNNRF